MSALLAFLHFSAIGGLIMILFGEWVLLRTPLQPAQIRFLARLDIGYVVFAALVLVTGLARALFGDKPWVYYAHNPVFHLKVGLFLLIGLISILPTLRFLRWKRAGVVDAAEQGRARRWVALELLLLPSIPACAVLMARGVGYAG